MNEVRESIIGVDMQALLSQISSVKSAETSKNDLADALAEALKRIEKEKELEMRKKKKKRIQEAEEKMARKRSGVKSDGVPIATPADPIRSYSDFTKLVEELRRGGRENDFRNAAIFEIGCATGLRGVDIMKIQKNHVWNPDGTFRDRIYLVEQKTGKDIDVLITEVMRKCFTELIASVCVGSDGYLFAGRSGSITARAYSRILKNAAKSCGIPVHISAHSMRHSFACIAQAMSFGDPKIRAYEGIQAAMNHSDNRMTSGYAKHVLREEEDRIRNLVSDFLLGKIGSDITLWEPEQRGFENEQEAQTAN